MKPFRFLALPMVALLVLASGVAADTLELRDGKLVRGRYLGGTQYNIRFEVNGRIQTYPVGDVLTLTIDRDEPAAPQAPAAAQAPVAPAAPADRLSTRPRPATRSSAPVTGPRSNVDVRPAAGSPVTVPAGTRLMVRMVDSVDSETNKIGDRFNATLLDSLIVDGVTVAQKGANVYGRLLEAKEAGRIQGRSELRLELTEIEINNQLTPIMTGDYGTAGEGRGGDTARKVGGGAALGAIIGAVAGGGKGAAIGAGVGAAAGGAVQVFTRGEKVRVPSETVLEFVLREPFVAKPAL